MKRESKEETIIFGLRTEMPIGVHRIKIRRPSDNQWVKVPLDWSGTEAEANIQISEDLMRESQLSMSAVDTLQNYSFQDDTHKEGVLTSLLDLVRALTPHEVEEFFFPLLRYLVNLRVSSAQGNL